MDDQSLQNILSNFIKVTKFIKRDKMKSKCYEFLSLQSDPELPKDINLDVLEPYLLFMPGRFKDTTSDYQKKLTEHFKDAIVKLKQAIIDNANYQEKQLERLKNIMLKTPENFEVNPSNRDQVIKYLTLFYESLDYSNKLEHTHLVSLRSYGVLVAGLLKLAEWLVKHPYLVFINLKRAMPNVAAKTFHADQKLFRISRAMNQALREQLRYVRNIPPIYVSIPQNRAFLQNVVDTAMASRKGGTSYFEELPIEEELSTFFDCSFSPLAKAELVPLNIPPQFDAINMWLQRAIDVIVKYDGIDNTERKEVIIILLLRYIFKKMYYMLKPELYHSPTLARTMEILSERSARENFVQEKYISKEFFNKPIKELFTSTSIAKAPVEWLNLTQFKVCPLDMAYCIFKVHESLSIMVTLQASNGKPESSDFFSQMPGFDDIFDIWICLLCVSNLCDPSGIINYIMKWSKLTGFPNRFMACCAYLEAAVNQLNDRVTDLPKLMAEQTAKEQQAAAKQDPPSSESSQQNEQSQQKDSPPVVQPQPQKDSPPVVESQPQKDSPPVVQSLVEQPMSNEPPKSETPQQNESITAEQSQPINSPQQQKEQQTAEPSQQKEQQPVDQSQPKEQPEEPKEQKTTESSQQNEQQSNEQSQQKRINTS